MQGRAAPIGRLAVGATPSPVPPPPAARLPPPPRPQPPIARLGWAGQAARAAAGARGLRGLRGLGRPDPGFGHKRRGALKNGIGGPARAYVSGSQTPSPELPVAAAAERRKLPICNQNRWSYWACPVPPLRLAGARVQLSSSSRQQ